MRQFLWIIALLVSTSSWCQAQDKEENSPPIAQTRIGALKVTTVRPEGARELLRNQTARVLSIEGNLSEWENESAPNGAPLLEQLQNWTRNGGVLILHTDVAQSFGFRTLYARSATRDQAGQLFGRARAALHFGMHPALWNGKSASSEGATFAALGVRIVFYQLRAGDCLVLGHPDGVPLLRVTDLARPTVGISGSNEPGFKERYAAAIAPYGRGWVLVLPRFIETQRADGEVFEQNVGTLIESLVAKNWVGMPTPPIERAYDRWRRRYRIDWARVSAEIRREMQDDNVEAAPEDVAQMLELDSDQTLSREQVDARFGKVKSDVRTAKEADFYQAIANATEGGKRRRLLFLATSRFRLLMPKTEIERTLAIFDRAAREQAAQNLRASKLPFYADDDNAMNDSGELSSEAEGFGAQSADEEFDESDELSEDESLYQSYRAAAAQMFVLYTHATAQRDFDKQISSLDWTRRARRVGVEPAAYWLWRGLLTAGEIDDTKVNSQLRLNALSDAAVSWQYALQSAPGEPIAPEPEADNSLPADYQLFGGEAETALREKTLQAQELQARQAADEAAQADEAPQVLAAAPKTVGGVPREVLVRWIADALGARSLLARDAPLGAEIKSSLLNRGGRQSTTLFTLNGGRILSSGSMAPLMASLMGGLPEIPQRGWLEDSHSLRPYRTAVLVQNGMNPNVAKSHVDKLYEPPASNSARPELITQVAQTLRLHSGSCVFGWNTDAEDITFCPSVGAMLSLANGVYRAPPLSSSMAAVSGKSIENGGPTWVEYSLMKQMERERLARVRANLPPQVALAKVRYTGSANTGLAVGTRILIPTAPDAPQLDINRALQKRQIRMMIGIPTALAKAHADVMINTITEGGTRPPQWMRDGFVSLSRQYMARAMTDSGFPTNGYFRAIPFGTLVEFTSKKGGKVNTRFNILDHVDDPNEIDIDFTKLDIWWANDRDYFTTCAQLALLGVPENPGTTLLPRLYQQIGEGGVTEIMQRLGSGESIDEAFGNLTGYSEKQWIARALSNRLYR